MSARYVFRLMNYLAVGLKTLTYFLIAVVLILAILLVGVRIFGIEIYTVLSGSMEPEYKTGGIIYVVDVDVDELEVGDDITFKLSGSTTATHRIIEVIEDSQARSFRTEGIANGHPDPSPVSADRVIGEAVFTIPYLGFLAAYIQSPPGLYVAISVGIGLLLLVIISDALSGYLKKRNAAPAEATANGAPAEATVEEKAQADEAPVSEENNSDASEDVQNS